MRNGVWLSLVLGTALSLGCVASPDEAPSWHRYDAEPWTTESIREEGDTLWVRVQTRNVNDAERIAERIVAQRKAQSWQTIHVEVVARVPDTGHGDGSADGRLAPEGAPPRTITSHYPHGRGEALGR